MGRQALVGNGWGSGGRHGRECSRDPDHGDWWYWDVGGGGSTAVNLHYLSIAQDMFYGTFNSIFCSYRFSDG